MPENSFVIAYSFVYRWKMYMSICHTVKKTITDKNNFKCYMLRGTHAVAEHDARCTIAKFRICVFGM